MSQKIKITLVKSSIGSVKKIIGTLKGLGLKKMQSTSILLIIFLGGVTVENTFHPYLLVSLAYVISFYGAMSSYILNERDDRMEQF